MQPTKRCGNDAESGFERPARHGPTYASSVISTFTNSFDAYGPARSAPDARRAMSCQSRTSHALNEIDAHQPGEQGVFEVGGGVDAGSK